MKIVHKEDYAPLRAKEYPSIGDQLDALMKLALALKTQGVVLPAETETWVQKCIQIKEKYKK